MLKDKRARQGTIIDLDIPPIAGGGPPVNINDDGHCHDDRIVKQETHAGIIVVVVQVKLDDGRFGQISVCVFCVELVSHVIRCKTAKINKKFGCDGDDEGGFVTIIKMIQGT